jgi:TRAP-type C4-dicarboxylate transport system permease small subunit
MRRLYDGICAAEAWVAGAFLILMVLLIFLGGVLRMIGWPINWSGDAATALFAWACFLCADIAWRRNSLMSVDVLTVRLPHPVRRAIKLLNYGLIAIFLVYLMTFGLYLSWISRARSFQGIPSVSYSWVTLSLSAGSLLLLITTIRHIRAELRGDRAEGQPVDVL